MEIRDLQRKLPKVSVDAAYQRFNAAELVITCVDHGEAPDRHVADLILATLALADALGVDAETAINQRLQTNGALLSK